MAMSWRLASRLSVVILALLVILVVALFSLRDSFGSPGGMGQSGVPSGLQGTELDGITAPDFRLKDQFGREVSLSQFRGKPVVVTFLYTHCPGVCPLIADQLHTTALGLGKDVGRVVFLAVSVDPQHDTPSSAIHFSNAHKMTRYWHYLMGTRDQLTPVWSAYGIDEQPSSTPDMMNHSAYLYVLDKEGRERVLLDNNFTPQQLIGDLRVLLGE